MTLPHNEQKHNNNQTSLQHIGNLAYQQGKSATSYDSINSLTTPNNQYTLLYPDLVQELFDFTLHNSNSSKNNAFFLRDLSVNNTKYSSLDSSLSPRDILFFLQIVSLYQLELSKGNSFITYPSLKLAKLLGAGASCDVVCTVSNSNDSFDTSCSSNTSCASNTSCSSNTSNASNKRATILKMTAKLEALGLLKVFRRKRKNGMDMTNKLIPVLPDKLHTRIKDLPSNLKVCDNFKLDHESNLEHILRTKLFVPIELEFMKSLFKNDLPSKYKLFFLNCIMSVYRNFRQNSSGSSSCGSSNGFSSSGSYSDFSVYSALNSDIGAERNTLDGSNMFSFSATSLELMKKNNISRSTLDRIFKYIKQQGNNFFLKVEHKYTKSDDIDCNRYDKSIFVISINPLVFPISYISYIKQSQTEGVANFDCDELKDKVLPIFPYTYKGIKTAWSKKQPSIVTKAALNNKEEIIKNKYSRNIDYIDESCENFEDLAIDNLPNICTSSCSETLGTLPKTQNTAKNYKEEFLEEEQSSSSSKFYNNSSFLNNSSNKLKLRKTVKQDETIIEPTHKAVLEEEVKQKEQSTIRHDKQNTKRTELTKPCLALDKVQLLELRHFYPLSEKDINLLNSRANREFSNNFVNQLLLKLYIKYPEKRFKNRFTFLSYMVQILANEIHQGPLVNHTTFRFSCNINEAERNLLEQEKYLNQIEDSLDTSKEMQVRKKIAGRFSTEVAYGILTQVEFRTNHDDSFITTLIPTTKNSLNQNWLNSDFELSERQIATLNEQLEAVYGVNGYYVQKVQDEMLIQPPKSRTSDIASAGKTIGILEQSKSLPANAEAIKENTLWHQIRKGLREELGEAIDTVWFSKALVSEDKETRTMTLTMPTRFMSDWVRNNYSHVIRRYAISSQKFTLKNIEYVYKSTSKF